MLSASLSRLSMRAAIAVAATFAGAVFGDTIRVPQDYPEIIDAINAAQPNDLILVDPGTYTGFGWGNKVVTVQSTHGPLVTRIVGGVFFDAAAYGVDRRLDGFTITGRADGVFSTRGGGGHVVNCISANNEGRGMGAYESNLYIENCLIAHNNLSWGFGGGITNQGGAIYATNVTVVANLGVDSAGIWDMSYFGQSTYTNCLVWDNGPYAIAGTATFMFCNTDPLQDGLGNISVDPRFVDSGAGNYRLAPGSPCIDAGSTLTLPPDMTLDLDGLPRRVDDPNTIDTGAGPPPIIDIGCYEFQAGGGFACSITTSCPDSGPATLSWTGSTPTARVVLLFSPQAGQFTIPPGRPCSGSVIGLEPRGLVVRTGPAFTSDLEGAGQVTGQMSAAACGGLIQLLDLGSCGTSEVVQVR